MSSKLFGRRLAAPFLCLWVCAAAYGCASSATGAGGSVTEPQSRTYELRVGEEKAVAGADFTLLLGGVPEDSRCPAGVDCIWAGSVTVELVFCGPKSEKTARLGTNAPPRALKYRNRYVRVTNVSPQRVEGRELKPADYVVTVEVSRDRPAAGADGDVIEIKDE